VIAILIGAAMAFLNWTLVNYSNGIALLFVGDGRTIQFDPPSGAVFYFGVYAFAAVLVGLGFRKLLGGRF
jgi:hypothetical protein